MVLCQKLDTKNPDFPYNSHVWITLYYLVPKVSSPQIRFLIHEARQLTHTPCDPVVVITIDKATRSTQICEDSTDPVYNEVKIFPKLYLSNQIQFSMCAALILLLILQTIRQTLALKVQSMINYNL